MNLERLFERAEALTLKRLKREGEIAPGCLIYSKQRGSTVLPLAWQNPAQKEIALAALAEVMELFQVEAYAIWSEVYWSERRGEWDGGEWKGPMPRDDPARKDALVIVACERGHRARARAWLVEKCGKSVSLNPQGELGHAVGPLGELLGKLKGDA